MGHRDLHAGARDFVRRNCRHLGGRTVEDWGRDSVELHASICQQRAVDTVIPHHSGGELRGTQTGDFEPAEAASRGLAWQSVRPWVEGAILCALGAGIWALLALR